MKSTEVCIGALIVFAVGLAALPFFWELGALTMGMALMMVATVVLMEG